MATNIRALADNTLSTGSLTNIYPGGSATVEEGKAVLVKTMRFANPDTSLVAQWTRDEIRQIGPGLYLGKVYWNQKRLMDFALKF